MNILITRPIDSGLRVKTHIEQEIEGVTCFNAPMLSISPISDVATPEYTEYDGIVLTSQYGINDALNGFSKEMPVYVTGERTAAAIKTKGFKNIHISDTGVRGIVSLIMTQNKHNSVFYYPSSDIITENTETYFAKAGIRLDRHIVYTSTANDKMPDVCFDHDYDVILFYSTRTVRVFEGLLKKSGKGSHFKQTTMLCLSARIASTLDETLYHKVLYVQHSKESLMINQIRTLLSNKDISQ